MSTNYFKNIPAYPSASNKNAALIRMIDGLGFRYYWATEGLRDNDLSYRPAPEAMSSLETIAHITYLVFMMECILNNKLIDKKHAPYPDSFEMHRKYSLEGLKTMGSFLRKHPDLDLSDFSISRANADFPIWHLYNGPLSDALYHVGQIVSFRRTTKNPINPRVNVFMGSH